MPFNSDFNGAVQEGAGPYQTTTRNARRSSAAVAYLWPAARRANLTVETGCLTTRILFSGNRAVGVEYRQGNETHKAMAETEVFVTAGAIGSPKIMMLPGIGPADHLKPHDIDVVQDLARAGQNLNDHFVIDIVC